jgi:hypothetical protein
LATGGPRGNLTSQAAFLFYRGGKMSIISELRETRREYLIALGAVKKTEPKAVEIKLPPYELEENGKKKPSIRWKCIIPRTETKSAFATIGAEASFSHRKQFRRSPKRFWT